MSPKKHECCCGNIQRLTTSIATIESRKTYLKSLEIEVVRRRRICGKCGGRFTSYEMDACDINFF